MFLHDAALSDTPRGTPGIFDLYSGIPPSDSEGLKCTSRVAIPGPNGTSTLLALPTHKSTGGRCPGIRFSLHAADILVLAGGAGGTCQY